LGNGRFGPVFLARRLDDEAVLIRTFTVALSDLQRERLLAALKTLCDRPLEHPSIARPIAAGLQDGRPYLVHAYLPGTSLADLTHWARPLDLSDIIVRLTYLAGALDFAEAAGVLHGALSAHDVIFSDESAGVSGFGLVQALESAGVAGFHARRDDDVAALMGIARELVGERVVPSVSAVLSGPVPGTALELAGALQATLPAGAPSSPSSEIKSMDVDMARHELLDIPLRDQAVPEAADFGERISASDFIDPLPAESVSMRPMFGAVEVPEDAATSADRGSRRSVRAWLITAAVALALGVFTGGFFIGRGDTPQTAAVATPAPLPEATNGQTFTDAAVDDPNPQQPSAPPVETPLPPPVEAARPSSPDPGPSQPAAAPREQSPPRSRAAAATPPVRTRTVPAPEAPSGPAAMRVDSLPAGAQVFVDGRSVGYTPMVVGALVPGTHSIRMQMPGYRPWVSAVTLGPGARERVAASLEQ